MATAAVVVDLALVAVSVVALWGGAAQFVTGASRAARRLGLSGLVIGLTVVAFGTSAPEFAVTIDAALAGQADISVGNVVGSNILNLGFVLGGAALIRAMPTSRELIQRDAVVLIGTTILVLLVLLDLRVTRPEGALLVGLLAGYLLVLARTGAERASAEVGAAAFGPVDLVRLVGGLAVVVVGARVLVLSASDLARVAGLSELVIGLTVVALGTSTPELATSLVAARRGRSGLSAGNLVGSCVFNFLGVLGLAAVIRPLPVSGDVITSMWWLLGIVVIAAFLFWSRNVLSRLEGALLVVLNAANWVVDLLL
jgi:cation:H+ antiporter